MTVPVLSITPGDGAMSGLADIAVVIVASSRAAFVVDHREAT